jgi:hypothetical protein
MRTRNSMLWNEYYLSALMIIAWLKLQAKVLKSSPSYTKESDRLCKNAQSMSAANLKQEKQKKIYFSIQYIITLNNNKKFQFLTFKTFFLLTTNQCEKTSPSIQHKSEMPWKQKLIVQTCNDSTIKELKTIRIEAKKFTCHTHFNYWSNQPPR